MPVEIDKVMLKKVPVHNKYLTLIRIYRSIALLEGEVRKVRTTQSAAPFNEWGHT